MGESRTWRYYAAVVASLVSTLAWIGAAVGALAIGYRRILGATFGAPSPRVVVALVVVGIAFAQVEKHLYTVDS